MPRVSRPIVVRLLVFQYYVIVAPVHGIESGPLYKIMSVLRSSFFISLHRPRSKPRHGSPARRATHAHSASSICEILSFVAYSGICLPMQTFRRRQRFSDINLGEHPLRRKHSDSCFVPHRMHQDISPPTVHCICIADSTWSWTIRDLDPNLPR